MAQTTTELLTDATSDRRLLEHPFYRAWVAGTLTAEDLREYSKQYFRQVDAFPGYLENVARGLESDRARAIVAANLSDEIDGDHKGLWLDFAAALGADAAEVKGSTANDHTQSCVASFDKGTAGDVAFALGMLWGYESQTPEVAQTKVTGLRDHYGVDGAGVKYFELHGELDVEHSNELVEALEAEVDESRMADAAAGARAGAEAIWTLLDGVCETRGIAC